MKRTYNSIKARANKLGLYVDREAHHWTNEEINILIEYYQTEGFDVYKRFNNISKQQIITKIKHLGILIHTKNPLWTKEEDDIIKQYYSNNYNKCLELLPNRTSDNIKQRASKLGIHKNKKSILCLETGEIFNNPTEAAKIKNINCPGNISAVCKRKKITAGKYHWAYLDDYNTSNMAQNAYIDYIESSMRNTWDDKELEILKQYYPIEGSNCFIRLPKRKKENVKAMAVKLKISCLEYNGKPKQILCVETNDVFNSIAEAGKSINRKSNTISAALNKLDKTAGGYHWKYIEDQEERVEE